jgi:hypothetical protein
MADVRRSECGVSVWLGFLNWHLVPKYIELLTRIRERDFENFVYEVVGYREFRADLSYWLPVVGSLDGGYALTSHRLSLL